jgi:hypothetical protein
MSAWWAAMSTTHVTTDAIFSPERSLLERLQGASNVQVDSNDGAQKVIFLNTSR